MSRQAGFSMLEVVIATALVTIAAGAMYNAFYTSQHFVAPGPHTAVRLIASRVDELKEYVRCDSISSNPLTQGTYPDEQDITLDGTNYNLDRTVNDKNSDPPMLQRNYRTSTISVSWPSQD